MDWTLRRFLLLPGQYLAGRISESFVNCRRRYNCFPSVAEEVLVTLSHSADTLSGIQDNIQNGLSGPTTVYGNLIHALHLLVVLTYSRDQHRFRWQL